MTNLAAAIVAALYIGSIGLTIAWVTILPSIGALYLAGYLD